MKLVAIAALLAVCGAAKLDRTYLPPASANTAGGGSDSLQTPLIKSTSGQEESSASPDSLPTGSYTNDFQGVVVDAAAAGIRASPTGDESGLGGPRDIYGSTNSKVGDAAFKGSIAGFRNTPSFGSSGLNGQVSGVNVQQNFGSFESKSERPQAFKDRNSNIITYANEVNPDNYSYGFETDNGIAIGENGVANNGIQAQGGYSYQGDDGQVYKVTYVADEGGYRPQGDHLPTPPPIPKEILVALEQNAKDEAAGLIDDGSYDAQKYNAEGDYTHHNTGNIQYNGGQLSQFGKRPESDATASNTFINQHSQAFGKPGQLGNTGAQNTHSIFNGLSNQFNGNKFGSNNANSQNSIPGALDNQSNPTLSGSQENSASLQGSGYFQQTSGSQLTPQIGQGQGAFESQSSQFEAQKDQQTPVSQFGSQGLQQGSGAHSVNQPGSHSSQNNQQLDSQGNQVGSASQLGIQANKPFFGQNPNSDFHSQVNQGTQFGNQAFKPQSAFGSTNQAQNNFGKPSEYSDDKQTQSQVSQIQFGTQGLNKPTFGSFSSNKPSVAGQSQVVTSTLNNNGNRFPNTPTQSGYEYLSPNNKPQGNAMSSLQESSQNNQADDVVPLGEQNQGVSQGSSASAFASVGPAGFEPQPAKPFNSFQSQFSGSNQFSYNNNNNQPISQGQTQSNAFATSSQHSESASALAAGSKPTVIPETELTTPFESNEKPGSAQESQFGSQSALSFGNIGLQSLNNQKPQNTPQQNTASSFPDSRPQGTSQFSSSAPTHAVFPAVQEPGPNKGKPQFPQSSFAQNQQNSFTQNNNNAYFSTQKPTTSQVSDDSYYYNQPLKPFSTPVVQSQGSRFPSSPSYQSNGIVSSQNNQFSNQQASSSTKFPSSSSVAPASPTPFPQFTQASISSFPSASPTTSSQYDTTQENQFGSKPSLNRPSTSQSQPNRPTILQQNTAVPSFPSKPVTIFGQKPSNSFTQNQIQFGQSSSNTNIQPSNSQSFPAKPITTFGQTPSSSLTQNQIQFGQSSSTNNDQPQNPEVGQEQQTTSTLTQQYQGTVYEYNKPAEVLPAPAQADSSSSQSIQTDSEKQKPDNQESKPQFGSHQSQFGQSTFSSHTQQSSLNQGANKPQYGTTFKPFGISSSNIGQFGQKPQSISSQGTLQQTNQGLQGNEQGVKPNESELSANTQFGQSSQASLGSKPQFNTQPFGSASSSSQFGQNTQQTQQSTGTTSSHPTQETQSSVQPFKPFGGLQSTPQFGLNTQSNFATQNTGSQFVTQPNKPFGSSSRPSQFGQAAHNQGSYSTGFSSTQQNIPNSPVAAQQYKPFGASGSTQGLQTIQPFGTTGATQGFQGYPSTKPQFGNQLTQTQFTHSSQQTFGATQVSSQPAGDAQTNIFGAPSTLGSTDSQKTQFGQNNQLNQGTQTSFVQQSFQSTQFSSTTLKPQYDSPAPFGQHESGSPIKPTPGHGQFSQNSVEASSSVTQQQPSSALAFNPFSTLSAQNSNFQAQNKPQFDQAPQSSLTASTARPPTQFGAQPFKPFSGSQGSQSQPAPQNKPFGTQGSPCCEDSKDSSIVPLNVGKPSQAFAQTQSQFTGFPGVQNTNAQAVAGKGEEFGGPRQPPSFDAQTGYHY